MQRENALERSLRYVRAVESVQVNGKTFRFVLCMFPEQSRALQQAKRITVDSAFKRVVGWKEFEIETWDDSSMRSITCARVFMDSLTADAYLLVLKRIYQTVLSDCDEPWQFSYLHGRGTDTSTTDQDNAEALAFGQFLQWITSNTLPPSSPFHSLTAYQHLAHILTLCITHHKRNLQPFKTKVSAAVFDAMQSLASPEPLPDINATFTTIRSGGKAASDWLANKLSGDAWALRALYRPWSSIPLVKWRAAPRTTNGNEQAHHNVNLDGTRLSLLAGIMHGADFDRRLLESRRAVADSGVSTRYKISDEFLRAERGLARHVRNSNKQLDAHDATIAEHSEALNRVNEQMKRQVQTLTAAPTHSAQASSARKRLRELHDQLPAHEERLRKSGRFGSGRVSYDIASEPSFDLALLKSPTQSRAALPQPSLRVTPLPPSPFGSLFLPQHMPTAPHSHLTPSAAYGRPIGEGGEALHYSYLDSIPSLPRSWSNSHLSLTPSYGPAASTFPITSRSDPIHYRHNDASHDSHVPPFHSHSTPSHAVSQSLSVQMPLAQRMQASQSSQPIARAPYESLRSHSLSENLRYYAQ